MYFDDFRSFLDEVDKIGELVRVKGADWNLEIGAMYTVNGQGPNPKILLFDEIKDFPKGYRIATNMLGSRRRARLAENIPLDANDKEVTQIEEERARNKNLIPPTYVTSSPILENVMDGKDVDLMKFPAPIWHELDVGKYLACASAVITQDPEVGWVNIGSYRSQLFDRNHVGLHTAHGHHGQVIRDRYFDNGADCPVVISMAQDPSLLAAAGSGTEWGVSEFDVAGQMRGTPVKVIRGRVTGLPIPASGEVVLEGWIMNPKHEPMRVEGGFGEASGYYSHLAGHAAPVVRIDAVYFRNDPIIAGTPPVRNVRGGGIGGHFSEEKFALEKNGFHDVRAVGHAGPFLVVSIHQAYAGHARRIADFLMSGVANRPPRFLVLVDEDIDPDNERDVFWAVSTRVDPANSTYIVNNVWISPTQPRPTPEQKEVPLEHGLTLSSMIIDACRPFAWKDDFPPVNDISPELRAKTIAKWGPILALEKTEGQGAPRRMMAERQTM